MCRGVEADDVAQVQDKSRDCTELRRTCATAHSTNKNTSWIYFPMDGDD